MAKSQSEIVKNLQREHGKTWKDARKQESQGNQGIRIPNNTLVIGKLTRMGFNEVKAGKKNAGKPVFSISFVVTDPEYRGDQLRIFHNLYTQGERSIDMALGFMAADLNAMKLIDGELPEDISKLLPAIDKMLKRKPLFKLLVSNVQSQYGPRVDIQGPATESEEEESGEEETEESEEEEETEEAAESEETESEEEEETEEEEYETLSIGDTVNVLPPNTKGKAKVLKINETKNTADVKYLKSGAVVKNIPLSGIEKV